jgi:uncharacterized protein YacL
MNTLSNFVFISLVIFVVVFAIIESFSRFSIKKIISDLLAIIVGLIMGALLSVPLSKLPDLYGEILPLIASITCVFSTLFLVNRLTPQIDKWIEMAGKLLRFQPMHLPVKHEISQAEALVDTSVLIDKRIVGIAKAGFLAQQIVIPKFILAELQNIADAKDGDRRDKGRRGLSALEELKKIKKGELTIISDDINEDMPVDAKLVAVAKKRGASLITTDFNLNKVASVQGVRVLNINDLAGSLRPDLLPGEEFEVKIVHIGKDKTQGVGYLADGTMIVVENASRLLDQGVEIKITRTLQTSAGKMYFARIIAS